MDGLNKQTYGIILAGGEGTRINPSKEAETNKVYTITDKFGMSCKATNAKRTKCTRHLATQQIAQSRRNCKGYSLTTPKINKTAFLFNGKPLIQYGVDLLENIVDKTIVVVGSYAESVKKAVTTKGITYAYQKNWLGTGHAVKIALRKINGVPEYILVGYGDHMMFYTKEIINKLVKLHQEEKAVMSLISVEYNHPEKLAWGRVIRGNDGYVKSSVEQKDATEKERKVKELNAGFYCFDYDFLRQNINKLKKSPVTGEYYINALVEIACRQKQKVCAFKVPFKYVGIGINTKQQLYESQKLYAQIKREK